MYQAAYTNSYKQQEVISASPLHLVIMAYDLAIRSCERKDFNKAITTISALRDCLDLDYPEVSNGLYSLYQWCMDCIRKGDYASASHILAELRGAWAATEQSIAARNSTVSSVPAFTSFGNILA
ncbi:flagellar export chaperone FliS [Candidatus Villigracilis saccharophilus]|uniref:flagellar export chaperone FliS n=1 Tax=Candidatus Villigracilis saccharophilus TaxID=3140684 RepID=UPI0031360C2B|nr:flagellar protein FliS [Anaerolineales bacterium]